MVQLLAIREAIDERRLASPISPSNPSSSPANRFNDNPVNACICPYETYASSIVKTAVLLWDFLLATGSMIAHSVDLFRETRASFSYRVFPRPPQHRSQATAHY